MLSENLNNEESDLDEILLAVSSLTAFSDRFIETLRSTLDDSCCSS